MRGTQFSDADFDQNDMAMLVGEAHHRIHDVLAMVEAAITQTQSASVEDYRAQLTARISALRSLHVITGRTGARGLKMADLIERTLRPYSGSGAQVIADGPDLLLQPKLALALHLIFNELAMNARKYGALSCPLGHVEVQWKVRRVPGASRKLAVFWEEHDGPEVKPPRRRGFGSRLLKKALEGYGGMRLDFNKTGLVCLMLIDLDHVEMPIPERTSPSTAPDLGDIPDVMTC
jgi:two-component sensor histidine kinase